MWEALAEVLDEKCAPPSKILSVGDGPGEPGCFLAARYGCPTITSDSVVPMVEAAKQRVEAKGLTHVECHVLDMQDLSAVADASDDVLSSAHAYPFSPDKPRALAEALRVLKPGGIFAAVVWVSFELLPFAGGNHGGRQRSLRACHRCAPPPPPMSLAEPSDALLVEAGFELREGKRTVSFTMAPELALRYCALPVWDRLTEMEPATSMRRQVRGGMATRKGEGPPRTTAYLASVRFSISGVYRVIVAKKPAA